VTLGLGGDQVEGRRAVRELLAVNRRKVREVWIASTVERGGSLADIVALAGRRGVPVRIVPRERLEAAARTDAPQGVLAFAHPLTAASLDELIKGHRDSAPPFLLVLDGVTDPHNVGALLRTAESAGATGAILARHRAAHVTPTVAKAAAGAIEHLPIAVVSGIAGALRTLADAQVWTVGLDPGARTSLWDLSLASEPVALVLGAEGRGLGRLVRERCDTLVAIPLTGATASLNVSAAGALACFEVARRRDGGATRGRSCRE
jgi:23S rRNA (guanosine2251-2'-O)-methyltransferase